MDDFIELTEFPTVINRKGDKERKFYLRASAIIFIAEESRIQYDWKELENGNAKIPSQKINTATVVGVNIPDSESFMRFHIQETLEEIFIKLTKKD